MGSTFQLGLVFFGLTSNNPKQISEARASVYRQIHQICFHGQGGYSWHVVYNMPLYLRKFIFNEIKTHYEEQNEQSNKRSSSPNKQTVSPSALPPKSLPKKSQPTKPQSSNPHPPKKEVKVPIRVQYK